MSLTFYEKFEQIIEKAKNDVIQFHGPNPVVIPDWSQSGVRVNVLPTKREWIETSCNHNLPEYASDLVLKMFVLQGGSGTHGVVLADYHLRTVVAFGPGYNLIKVYRQEISPTPYEEIGFNTSRRNFGRN